MRAPAEQTTPDPPLLRNREIADHLREAAVVLDQQGANPYRVAAYRNGANTVANLAREVADIAAAEGIDGLIGLPAIGKGIAAAIMELVITGRWSQLERWRGTLDPVRLFRTIPGIGRVLAQRIHDELDVDTLEALEMAAHDGRLAKVAGISERRVQGIRAALASALSRRGPRPSQPPVNRPTAALLLDVDREYRSEAAAGHLPQVAPKRFNPDGRSWLPVLHTTRGRWHFAALYSNTALAHRLGRTGDWVVIYGYDDHHQETQATVVAETRGPLKGKRVVRGREMECRSYYEAKTKAAGSGI